jgi:hypothetical protein
MLYESTKYPKPQKKLPQVQLHIAPKQEPINHGSPFRFPRVKETADGVVSIFLKGTVE